MMDLQSPSHAFEADFSEADFKGSILPPSSRDTLPGGSGHGLRGSLAGRQQQQPRDGRPAKSRIVMRPVSSFGTQDPSRPTAPPKAESPRPQRRASLGPSSGLSSSRSSHNHPIEARRTVEAFGKIDSIRQSFETTLASNLEYGFTTILPSSCATGNAMKHGGPMRRRASLNGSAALAQLEENIIKGSTSLHRPKAHVTATIARESEVFDGFEAPNELRKSVHGPPSSPRPRSKAGDAAGLSRSSHQTGVKPRKRLSDPVVSRSAHGTSPSSDVPPSPRRSEGAPLRESSSSLHASHQPSRVGPARRRASLNTVASSQTCGSGGPVAPTSYKEAFRGDAKGPVPPAFRRTTSQPMPGSSHHSSQVMRRRASMASGSGATTNSDLYMQPAPSPRRSSGPRRIQRRTSIGNRYGVQPPSYEARPESPSFAEEADDGDYGYGCDQDESENYEGHGPTEMASMTAVAAPSTGRTTKRSAGRIVTRRRRLAAAVSAPASKPAAVEENSVLSQSTDDTQSSHSDHP